MVCNCKCCVFWEKSTASYAQGFGICKNKSMFLKTKNLSQIKDKNLVLISNSGDTTFITGETFGCVHGKNKTEELLAQPKPPSKRVRNFYQNSTLNTNTQNIPKPPPEPKTISQTPMPKPEPKKRYKQTYSSVSLEQTFSNIFDEKEEKPEKKPVRVGRRIHNKIVKTSSTILRGTYKKIYDEETGENRIVTVIGGKELSRNAQGVANASFYFFWILGMCAIGAVVFFILTRSIDFFRG